MTAVETTQSVGVEVPPAAQVLELTNGVLVAQIVYAAAKLGLADLIAAGATHADRLASATGTHPEALQRLLRCLRMLGLVTEEEPGGAQRLTDLGECLRSDHPQSVRQLAILAGEHEYLAWSDPLYSLRTGEPAFDRVHGRSYYDHLAARPDAAAAFNGAMAELARQFEIPAVSAYDFSRASTVVDLGGGTGALLAHLLRTHAHLRGVLFDLPGVIAGALPELRDGALADRCTTIAGDFFEAVPRGGDTYLMSFILHDFDDELATRLLRNVRAVIPADGELIVLTFVLPADDTPSFATLVDLHMLVQVGGRERTRGDLDGLFDTAGFRVDRVIPHPSELNLLVAVPI